MAAMAAGTTARSSAGVAGLRNPTTRAQRRGRGVSNAAVRPTRAPHPIACVPDALRCSRSDARRGVAVARRTEDRLRTRATDASVDAPEGGIGRTLMLGSFFGVWYFFNIFFNIYNKQVLKTFPYPFTITCLQFAVGSVIACLYWLTGAQRPKLRKQDIKIIFPLACVHLLGNLLTNVSLGKVAVSFTHTIKAMEPFFSVAMSSAFLGDTPSIPVILSLLPIVGGVGLASATEASFNWAGFGAAMGSNITFQSRNVFSKKLMTGGEKNETLNNINLFSLLTITSFFLLFPIAFFVEGAPYAPKAIQALTESAGVTTAWLVKRALFAGVCFHSYQQVSYMILQRVSPVTHSIGNCVKRVVVIVSSVIVFQTPVSALNAIGTAIALSGVFMYSQVKRLAGKKSKAA